MKQINFLNLTNGLEYIDKVDNPQFIRIRSTTLERQDYLFLLMDLDHNLLMNLAIGNKCVIYDCGANKKLSKTIYKGVPFIRYALQRRWLGYYDKPYRFTRCGSKKFDIEKEFTTLYDHIFIHNQNNTKSKLKAKLDYYKKYITGDIFLEGLSQSTDKDGNESYWKNKIK